jgi:hypothetical protein
MRSFSSLLTIVMVGVFLIGCQDSTMVPRENATQQHRFAPVSPATDYVLYGVSSLGDALSILDPETGVSTLIGPLDPDPKIFVTPIAMAVRSCDGGIFVWNNSNAGDEPNTSVPDGRLLTVDPCTGLGTAVDAGLDSQGQLSALAFHPDGRLFGTDANLVEIDPTSGVVTPVGSLGLRIAGADFHPVTGVLYGAELGNNRRFGTINTETGEFTEIGTLDGVEGVIGAIAFDLSGNKLYGTAMYEDGVLFEIDLGTAAVSNIITVTGVTPQGMGFAPVCGQGGGDCGDPQVTELTLVIKPGGCPNPLNPKSKGVTPMALLGSDGMDIDNIDVSSIEINGVSPIRSNRDDVGGPAREAAEDCECAEGDYDGIFDLTLKFSTQEIVATLGAVSRGDVVELTLTGTLNDGTAFEASECVVIVGK